MTAWLHTQGFSYKKPTVVPGKADREAQEQWIKTYEELKANLQQGEAICFTDGVHPTHNIKTTYGWIRKGERKKVRTNTGRQRLNLSGAIDIIPLLIQESDFTLRKSLGIRRSKRDPYCNIGPFLIVESRELFLKRQTDS
jgi:hypothetical protein